MNKKREWVKNAAIIFLIIMLLLTFFSNTIMNYSLPEVSAQYVSSGNLSEQIRGSGTIEANQTYEVKMDETRTISAVEVKVGDEVKKDDVLFRLEDSDSAELDTAEKNLRSAQKAYNEALLTAGFDYSAEELDIQIQEENIEDLKNDLKNISEYQEAYEKAKAKTEKIEKEVKDLERESKEYDDILAAIAAEDYTSLGSENYNKIKSAQTKLENAEKDKTRSEETIKEYEEEIAAGGDQSAITSKRREIEDKQSEISGIEDKISRLKENGYVEDSEAGGKNTEEEEGSDESASSGKLSYSAYEEQLSTLESSLETANRELRYLQEDYSALLSKSSTYSQTQQKLTAEKQQLERFTNTYDNAKKALDDAIASLKQGAKSGSGDLSGKLDDAKVRLEEAQAEEAEAKEKASVSEEEQQDKIKEAENNLKKARIALSKQKSDDAISASKDELNISDLAAAVEDAEAEVEKYKSKSVGAEIKAKVGGVITALSVVAGEDAEMGSTIATIEMTEKGYTLEMPVTIEQSRKVKVGDEAEIQYFWYGDAKAVLESINPDKTNPAQTKILKFSVTGDVTPGQTLQLSMGSKGQRYDYIVPNSSVREDSNGKFVLVVTAKSSPLGNRYIAERVDVDVLASDDTQSAVSGGFLGGEFIISTSTKPIEPGMQVRLVE